MNSDIIEIVSGDAKDLDLEFRDKNKDLLDMSDCTVKLTARDSNGDVVLTKDSTVLLADGVTYEIEWEDQVTGQAIIHFIESDTESYEGVYDYDIEITYDDHRYTPIVSKLIVSGDVTR